MKTKAQYKVKNWNAYDAALKQRGSIRFWVNEEVIEQWRNQQKTGRKGASNYYSDVAIATALWKITNEINSIIYAHFGKDDASANLKESMF
ncbi:transposase [Fischerella muscicola]|uniref:transposase n=1 Tax=Fischerella TaxID=1190 RepID=UPI0002E3247D|nr:transposase [Fischerella sp. FACHB-380]